MTRLVRAELRRFFSRRMLRWLGVLAVGAAALGGLLTFINTAPAPVSETVPRGDLTWILMGSSMWLIFGAWVIGASFVGAEWQRGTMTTTLTWESRRGRVWGAKLMAAAIGTGLWYASLLVLLLAFLAPSLTLHGRGSVDVVGVSLVALRGGTLAVLAATCGGAVAMIGRTTAAAIGAGFAWFAVAEGFGRALRPQWVHWYVGENAGAFLTWAPTQLNREPAAAALVVGLYASLLLGAGWAFFARRDVG